MIIFGFMVTFLNADIVGKNSGCKHSESRKATWRDTIWWSICQIWLLPEKLKMPLSHPLVFFSILQDQQIDAYTAEPSLKRNIQETALMHKSCIILYPTPPLPPQAAKHNSFINSSGRVCYPGNKLFPSLKFNRHLPRTMSSWQRWWDMCFIST